MAISDRDIMSALASYLERYPEEAALLSEPMRLLSKGGDFASRRTFPMHVTAGVLLVRDTKILLVEHRAYGIVLQPGGHLEPAESRWPARRSANWRRRPVSTRATVFRVSRPPCTSSTAGSRHGRRRTSQIIFTLTLGSPLRRQMVMSGASRNAR